MIATVSDANNKRSNFAIPLVLVRGGGSSDSEQTEGLHLIRGRTERGLPLVCRESICEWSQNLPVQG